MRTLSFSNTLSIAALLAATSGAAVAQSMSPPTTKMGDAMDGHMMMGPVDGRTLSATEIDRVAVGTAAPDFTLAKMGGGSTTLSSFRGKKNVVLVFYRGSWCPYCIKQLAGMRSLLDADMKKDTELLAVSVDGEADTQKTMARISADGMAADFQFLSDADHAVIARYGILNPDAGSRFIPHPATYVIDRDGVVRWRDIETDYKIRPANAQIVAAVRALPHAMMMGKE
jgi:peroxiredoxin